MRRKLQPYILEDLPQKIVLISGPRQTGKTTISKQLYPNYDYLNYDSTENRLAIHQESWDRSKKILSLMSYVNTPSAKAEGFSRLRVPLLVPQLRCGEGF